ncbi:MULTISPECIES: hypothetical protein [unclassified Rhizobium]|uniref:hypothetical protein n=1 Tax=unclassified Rhizobium TaxID=2613769 RepID=UPI001ADB64F7|nr:MULTISPECIES: hypothetical protein [unclassified Rhizobium]MBO9099407.1 hypothetical protein [Rhizobium sp. L58/93]QXZ87106.1 hypothetical protein J5287_21210 [Rhizobium sp. K1/93]QXZ92860.1 hypothetical protein J5280_19685 [Rhizobium sp. K15/93]
MPVSFESISKASNVAQSSTGIDVGEIPSVGRQLSRAMLEPVAAEQQQLILGKARIDPRNRRATECDIPVTYRKYSNASCGRMFVK